MPDGATSPETIDIRMPGRAARWGEIALVLAIFAIYAGWPIPEPNEPHYLGKARHFWDPSWIAGDFFLDSADSHGTFYFAVGWLSRWFSLATIAWWGRAATWGLLAIGWSRMVWRLVPRTGAAALAALVMVAANERCQMAGEWVVGGFEAKGFAYAFVFFALAELFAGRWNRTWVLLGAASAFHVLVGGWAALAVGFCWLTMGSARPALSTMLPGLTSGGALALLGLLPALKLTGGESAASITEASRIYVYERLPHHLSFFNFPAAARVRFGLLTLAWVVLARLVEGRPEWLLLRRVATASLLLVLIGIAVSGLGFYDLEVAARLLRFYWFRLADVFLPVGFACAATAVVMRTISKRPAWGWLATFLVAGLACWALSPQITARLNPSVPRADKPGKVANYADWRDACRWIAENTPEDSRFLTPRTGQTFKWYAGRSEVATWKDLPQDAPHILEWWQRLQDLHGTDGSDPQERWHDSLTEVGIDRLRRAGQKYGAGYILTDAEPALDLPRLYHNKTYAVYRLTP